MIDESFIGAILKDWIAYKKSGAKDKEPYPTYRLRADFRESVRNHAEKGVFPETLFKLRSPNETDEEIGYRKASYKQTTLPIFMDYLAVQQRAYSDSNWSIEYKADADQYADETFQEYVERIGLEQYIFGITATNKSIDANGVMAIRPKFIPDDADELIEPVPFFYTCTQIMAFKEKEYYLIDTNRKSVVTYGSVDEKSGYIFEFYDRNNIWLIEQYGKKIEYTFRITKLFEHNMAAVPVHQMQGVAMLIDNEIVWQSPFLFAVDNLDLVVLDTSNLQISKARTAFPIPVMYGIPCDFEDTTNGYRCMDGNIMVEGGGMKSCPKCNGSGLKSRLGVQRTVLLNPATPAGDGDSKLTQDPLKYVSPSPDILEFLRSEISEHEQRARKILHLPDADDNIQANEGQTATGSGNKLKSLYAFIKPISDQLFGIYEFALNTIGWQRYGESFQSPRLNRPITFDFKTEADYIADIESARKAGLPTFAIRASMLNYLRTFYFTDSLSSKALQVIEYCDRLMGMSDEEIMTMSVKQLVAAYEIVIHYSAATIISQLLTEDEAFFDKDFDAQTDAFIALSKDMARQLMVVDEAVEGVTNESASELRSTVGGLTGMIEIIKAVSSGIYERDAAVQLVMERFGLTQEQAEKQVGNPKVISDQQAATTVATMV